MICVVCHLYASATYRGACERCNATRLRAALEYVHAGEQLRLMNAFCVSIPAGHRRPPARRTRLEHAMFRLASAEEECVRLQMWPAGRSTRRPPWHYGDERSNTR